MKCNNVKKNNGGKIIKTTLFIKYEKKILPAVLHVVNCGAVEHVISIQG